MFAAIAVAHHPVKQLLAPSDHEGDRFLAYCRAAILYRTELQPPWMIQDLSGRCALISWR